MIVEHAEFRLHPGAGASFEAAFAAVRPLLLEASGCRAARLLPSVDRPDTYLLEVDWDRLEDHAEVFPGTEVAEKVATALGPHCAEPPRVVHYASSL